MADTQSLALDFAEEKLIALPCHENAANLLTVATEYLQAGMIGEDTYVDKVLMVRDMLQN